MRRYREAYASRADAAEFGIVTMTAPDGADVPQFRRTCATVVRGAPEIGVAAGEFAFTVDANVPLEAQIEAIARAARPRVAAWRAINLPDGPRRVPNAARLIIALRAWDGREQGAGLDEIARVLFPRAKPLRSAREALQLADEMIAGGYLDIALRETGHFSTGSSSSSYRARKSASVLETVPEVS
ncbi:MAG: DUF2285 domain-containing protein [Pseudomonadota bacterium]|nr:DUF2285 domain-containing protein [Pseudomonadota bacterium]